MQGYGKRNSLQKKKEKQGSFTIELALLMPFLIGSFLFVFFMAYYMHDRCLLEKACQSAVLRGSGCMSEEAAKTAAYETIDEILLKKLLWKWEFTKQVEIDSEKISVFGEGVMLVNEGGNRPLSFSVECSAKRINEPVFIRSQKGQGKGYCSEKAMKKN
ncbi:MAG TPA: TadE/TadG family type IV pilus assembly protein [Lachnospiraceae bacterium]|nr:TadE/TadG family type IV pilus assembly protein [Lachnospiraceae bacterium]